MTKQHVMNIETLSEEQNCQLQRSLKFEHQVEMTTSIPGTQVTTCESAPQDKRIKSVHKGKNSGSVRRIALEGFLNAQRRLDTRKSHLKVKAW